MDNLKKFLKTKDPDYPATYGYNFLATQYYDDENNQKLISYNSGGAGYVLSNSALKRITAKLKKNYNFCPMSGTEDMDVAQCFEMLEISTEKVLNAY